MSTLNQNHDTSIAGFTLLEMVVVVAILALAAAVTMPLLAQPSEALRLQAGVRDLLSALRATRAAAIAANAELAVMIDVDRRTFESPVVPRRSFASGIATQLTFAEPLRETESRGGIRFFPDGSATGGTVRLAINGHATQICLDWFTGTARQAEAC